MKGVSVLLFISALTAPTVLGHMQPLGFHGKCVAATWVPGTEEDAYPEKKDLEAQVEVEVETSGQCLKECMSHVMNGGDARACQWSRTDKKCYTIDAIMEFGDGGSEDICFVFFQAYNYYE